LLFGFDWLSSVIAQPALWKPLAQSSFNRLVPAPINAGSGSANVISNVIANDRIERLLRVTNTGAAMRVQVSAELTPGLKLLASSSGAPLQTLVQNLSTGTQVRWQFDLAGSASRELNLTLQMPADAGAYDLRYQVHQLDAESQVLSLLSNETVRLSVEDVALLATQARAAVEALPLIASAELTLRLEVLQQMEQAASAVGPGQQAASLQNMALAQTALLRITAQNSALDVSVAQTAQTAQTAVARLARAVQRYVPR
jgi:hypothetical protein